MFECTQLALETMRARLADMEGRQRAELAALVTQSQADETNSDENAGFRDAHQQFNRLEREILALREKVDNAVVVGDAGGDGTVGVGAHVVLDIDGDPWKVLVGHIIETSDFDVVSPSSPLGQALLGSSKGATVNWRSPGGDLSATIIEVS